MNESVLPKPIVRFLRWFCPDHLLEEIEGDLLQRFQRDVKNYSEAKARRRLWWNAIRFFRPGIILRNKLSRGLFQNSLVKSHFNLAVRVLARNKVFAGISVFGLSVSIAACILILEYTTHEFSFDKFFTHHKNIYRLHHTRFANGELLYRKAMSFPEVGAALKDYFPEIEDAVRLFPASQHIEPVFTVMRTEEETLSFSESNVYLTDSSFVRIFNLSFFDGDPASALTQPGQVILSASTALRYFGRTDVAGKTLEVNNLGIGSITIIGVFRDLPPNSHFKIDILLSPVWADIYADRSRFTWDGFYNYVLLKDGADIQHMTDRLSEFSQYYISDYYQNNPDVSSQFDLVPLADIHLHSHAEGEMGANGNAGMVYALMVVAVFIISIAVVNHVNLTTSRSVERVREVGIRKTIGSSKGQLTSQFLIESCLLNAASVTIALVVVWLVHPAFNRYFNSHISLSLWQQPSFWTGLAAFVVVLSVIAAFYPVFILNRLRIYDAIRGLSAGKSKTYFQKTLIAFQFTISLILITGTGVLLSQIDFMQTRDLGFGMRHKLVVKMLPALGDETDSAFTARMQSVRNELKNYSFVRNSSISSSIPGRKNEWRGRTRLSDGGEEYIVANLTRIDEDFIPTFDLRLIAGRNYSSPLHNEHTILVNEETTRQLGFVNPEDALGRKINTYREREIIGIVESFHEAGLHEVLSPSLFIMGEGYTKYLTISLADGDISKQLETIGQTWKKHFPEKPFQYFFLDNYFNRQYQADIVMGRSISVFSGMAVIIACLGLFSLSVHTLHRKTKEIGIRKILGAGVVRITRGLCGHFLLPVSLAAIAGVPASYYLATWWLEQYAYKIDITPPLLVTPLVVLLGIGMLTIIVQSVRAASKNPADSLKHE